MVEKTGRTQLSIEGNSGLKLSNALDFGINSVIFVGIS